MESDQIKSLYKFWYHCCFGLKSGLLWQMFPWTCRRTECDAKGRFANFKEQ